MDIPQIRKLKPKLEAIPQAVRRLLPPQGHPRPPAGVRLRAALGHPREERRADRDQRRRAGPGPCRSSSASTTGMMTGRATGSSTSSATSTPGPTRSRILDETSDVKKGDKTPGVQRQWCGAVGKKENCIVTVHLGLRPRRLPRPARRRVVPAGVLVRGPRPLPRGRHPRRHGLPAQVEDRPGAVRPRRPATACTSTG